MAKQIVKETEKNVMYHHTGVTRFTGCQCIKDCTCNEDFKPAKYDYYTVKRKNKKTTYHSCLADAEIRWTYLESLEQNKTPVGGGGVWET